MKKIKLNKLLALVFFINILFYFPIIAEAVTFPKMDSGVTDTTNLLTTNQKEQINTEILTLEDSFGAQLAVLIVGSTEPLTIEQYAEQLFNRWQLGRKNIDDGALLLIALDDHTVRIEVGYGLEDRITDHQANQIIQDYIIPEFKRDQYYSGIKQAVSALIAQINSQPLPPVIKDYYIAKDSNDFGVMDIISAVIVGCSFLFWFYLIYIGLKNSPYKVGISLSIILLLTWLCGGFNIDVWNGIQFGEDFLNTDLPYWVQVLLLKIFPSWLAVVFIFTVFIVSVSMGLLLIVAVFSLISKLLTSLHVSKKMQLSMISGLIFAIFGLIFITFFSGSLLLGIISSIIIGIFITWQIYTGKMTVNGNNTSSNGSRNNRGRTSNSSSGGSGSSRSGGGGRSGGGVHQADGNYIHGH